MIARGDVRVLFLADRREAIPLLVCWFEAEWAPYYGSAGPGNAKEDLTSCCNREALPIALIAVDEQDNVLGTAALKAESAGSEPGQCPWLAALLVGKDYRGRGIAARLIEAIENLARGLGFGAIYISTDIAQPFLRRRGWRPLKDAVTLKGPVSVYKRDLAACDPG